MKNEKIIHRGIPYRRYPESKRWSDRMYFRCSFYTARSKKVDRYLHRQIWIEVNGDIPEGYEIHHKDRNAFNNRIDNLEVITISEHKKYHASLITEERRELMRKNMLEKAIPAAAKRIRSKEELQAASERTKIQMASREFNEYVCDICGKKYLSKNLSRNRFCSNNCKSAYRRHQGVDNIEFKCPICGKVATKNKYSDKRTCSRECGRKLVHK